MRFVHSIEIARVSSNDIYMPEKTLFTAPMFAAMRARKELERKAKADSKRRDAVRAMVYVAAKIQARAA